MRTSPNIVMVGHVCIDQNVSEGTAYTSWGSALMYMDQFSRQQLGVKPALLAPYGEDFEPFSNGASLINAQTADPTLVYRNTTTPLGRSQSCENTEFAKPVNLAHGIKHVLSNADVILVAPLLPNFSVDYIRDVMGQRKPGSISALLPQGYFRTVSEDGGVSPREFTEATDILDMFDLAIFSEEDTPNALQQAGEWCVQSSVSLIVTQGNKGATGIVGDEIIPASTRPVPPDQIVDSVGCGDTFSMAAIYDYYRCHDLGSAMAAGNEAARDKLLQAVTLDEAV